MKDIIEKFQHKKQYSEHAEAIDNHLSKFFDEEDITVFHEMLSMDFHLDVYFIKPKESNFNILLTCGMSAYEMMVPEDIEDREDLLFAELMILIPKNIEFSEVYTGQKKNDWLIAMLKYTARFPHHYDTFLAVGHTIQATADLEPYSDETDFVACIVLPSVTFEEDFTEFMYGENKINIYGLFPLYKNELEYKVKNGYSKFVDLLQKADPEEKIDNKRKNLIRE
jgi:hypothetical protein